MQKRIYGLCFAISLVFILSGKLCLCADEPIRNYEERIKMFEYNPGDSLDVKNISRTKQDDAWLHDITFASPKGGRVTAFLVTPTTESKHPAIIFAHGGGSNRREFLTEALLFAKAGAVSLLIDAPSARPEQWRRQWSSVDDPEQARESFIQAIIDLRRCVDLLRERPDVDTQRIGFVGFSYGATLGGILCGIEKRISAYALMGGGLRLTEFLKNYFAGQAGLDKYIQTLEPFNVVHYIVHSVPAAVLYHFGRQDLNVPENDALEFYNTGQTPKDIKWWNGGHNHNSEAIYQRIQWFHEKLDTKLLIKEPAPVEGTWAATADGPDGNPLEVTYEFEVLGNTLLGTVNTRLGGGPFAEGKIDGNKISFVVNTGQAIIETTGTISGNEINFTQRNGERVVQFTAQRVGEGKNDLKKRNFEEINESIYLKIYKAYHNLDYEMLKEVFAEDLIRIAPDIKMITDYNSYMEGLRITFQGTKEQGSTLEVELRFFERLISDTLASDRGIYKYFIDKGTEKEQIFYGKFHLILKKYNDKWKLVVDYDSNEGGSIGEEEFMKAYAIDDYDKFLQ